MTNRFSDKLDIIIRGGIICDGEGVNPPYETDIGISGDRIVIVGDLKGVSAERKINAGGLIVAPGFIDIHSHTDEVILINPEAKSKIYQGVTTEVVGNCGASPAPLFGDYLEIYRSDIEGSYGIKVTWKSCKDYFNLISERGIGINYAMLVGNGNIRGGVIGFDDKKSTVSGINDMKMCLAECFEEGAWGISSGLIYVPSCFSDENEMIQLAQTVKTAGGMYSSHIRGEGDNLVDAIKEAVAVAGKSGVRLQISHLKAAGIKNWEKVDKVRNIIEQAIKDGVDVSCDVYPYNASSTGIDSIFPSWVKEGGKECFVERLKDEAKRERILDEIRAAIKREEGAFDLSKIVFSSFKVNKEAMKRFLGKSVEDVGRELEKSPLEAVFDLLIEQDGDISVIFFTQSEDNVKKILQYPYSSVGSDATARSPSGVLSLDMPHPRAYGTFPRVLGKYVREEKVIKIEEAVRKMTFLPATRMGFGNRGLIKQGMFADITIFDPDKICDLATYLEPHKYPLGIEYVLVNGRVVIENGDHTGVMAGRVLQRNKNSEEPHR